MEQTCESMNKNRIQGVSAGRAGNLSRSPYPSRARSVDSATVHGKRLSLPSAPPAKPLPPNQIIGNYLNGKWIGYAPVENRGTCGMILQINNLFNPGQLFGAVNVGCIASPTARYSL